MKSLRRTGLYKSLHLLNEGTDTALHGLHNLKCNPHLLSATYQQAVLDLQHRRIVLNLQFLSEMQQREQTELDRLEQQIQTAAAKP